MSLVDIFACITGGNFPAVPGSTQQAYSKSSFAVFLATPPLGIISILAPNVEACLADDVARRLHGNEVPLGEYLKEELNDERERVNILFYRTCLGRLKWMIT
ncbi:uncharacterized protein BDZ99DRAFT_577746 [Mytilinidion resinicola]|uniref:Uncharacterized protein n=1 Tax=Mytilinidion resinicola TaxID=574789 RepID=A0A6A6XY38_9PEZI|nr:uncharacterized protein BDZ99DRAFT_577746 [Mytilinidion resinicola]KAF2801289.1 hypothetical protein BDZ99DRAFT_577746 [Mytilinidion resinicola]